MNNEELNNIIDFRLQSIETQLKELKELLVTVPILMNKLEDLSKDTQKDIDKLNEKIDVSNSNIEKKISDYISTEVNRIETRMDNEHASLRMEAQNRLEGIEKRVDALEINFDLMTKTVNDVKGAEGKKAISRYNYILEYAYKILVAGGFAGVIYLLSQGKIQL